MLTTNKRIFFSCSTYLLRFGAWCHGALITVLFIILSTNSIGAQNCFNSDLETGQLEGYTTYIGTIHKDGLVSINTPGSDSTRHRIFNKNEGVDPIAKAHCLINRDLPVVPDGGGQFALRLGNSNNGGEAERVVLRFTVTEESTFFLLRYAVVINDPGHEHFEQPRFELRILDANGTAFPCGLYSVRAGKDIPGFENCGDWRIRPWTTAGIELRSFLGQEIQIEILTTDCARGGHAGYAYLDATCKPLKIDLEGYCPGSSSAKMIVTDGFDKYQWSTGDSTNAIDIERPIQGTPYSVTVTSSTGCTLVLSDTIPQIVVQPQPIFSAVNDTTVCMGEQFWFTPTGTDLNSVYSLDLQVEADSFLLNPFVSQDFTFLAHDLYHCKSDTLIYKVNIADHQIDEIIDSTTCFGGADGSITLIENIEVPYLAQTWSNGQTGMEINNLIAGRYSVVVVDSLGCIFEEKYIVEQPREVQVDFNAVDVSCSGVKDGSINAEIEGGTAPYELTWGHTDVTDSNLIDLDEGRYVLTIRDSKGCIKSDAHIISQPSALQISLSQTSTSCWEGSDGSAEGIVRGGVPPYEYRWDDQQQQETAVASGLNPGNYVMTTVDQNGCVISETIEVTQPNPIEIELTQEPVNCYGGSDGMAMAKVQGGTPSYQYIWENFSSGNDHTSTNLSAGLQRLIVIDANGCTSNGTIMITEPSPITITPVDYIFPDCNVGRASRTIIRTEGGIGDYEYLWETGDKTNIVESSIRGYKTVQITDGNGCIHIDSAEIKTPEISISVEGLTNDLSYEDPFICAEDELVINVSSDRVLSSILWSAPTSLTCADCATVIAYPEGTYIYEVKTIDESGCLSTAQVEVMAVENCGTYIPNVFSPNGDGENDHFFVVASTGATRVEKFEIFNRWGSLIYQNSNIEVGNPYDGWDGTVDANIAETGVYVYMIEISFLDKNESSIFTGDVLLKR